MSFETGTIRNIAVMGHSGEGKTSLCETILYNAKVIDRIGKTSDGNTVMDYDDQEIARQMSISLSVASCGWKGKMLNLIDLPGFYDFEGEVVQGLSAADSALIVVGPWGNVSVGTEKAIEVCSKAKMPMMIFINQIDKENANIGSTIDALIEKYGNKIAAIQTPIMDGQKMKGYIAILDKKAYLFADQGPTEIPIPEEYVDLVNTNYEHLVEVAAENDEELLDKFFNGEQLSYDEVIYGVRKGIASDSTIPVLCGCATANKGVFNLMDEIINYMPAPKDNSNNFVITSSGDTKQITVDNTEKVSLKVFKTIADPFVGKMNIVKVMTGILKAGDTLINQTTGKAEKIGSLLLLKGKKQKQTEELQAGDIGALAKLSSTNTGDTLCHESLNYSFPKINFPKPILTMAVTALDAKEEEKVIQGLYRINEEDSTFTIEKNIETGQMLLSGMGETHLDIILKKLQSKFKVSAKLATPTVPYRETIKKKIEAEGKHKKQSGGHGQYGHCKIRFEPCDEDFIFDVEVVGGSVPKSYIPAVEKGLRECLPKGIRAGCKVVGLKAVLYDGSYHDVDSSEMAFKLAAAIAFKEGLKNAGPVLLEPIYSVEIVVNENYMGDILSDMNKRRGRILGMEANDEGKQVIKAEAPLAEMYRYATDLRSITQGRGIFSMKYERYEEAPNDIAKKVIDAYESSKETN